MNTNRVGPILVVDDEESIRELLSNTLTDEGFEVLWAENGREALAVVSKESPVLILLDLAMPVMDGREFMTAYQHFPEPRAPIVLVAAALHIAQVAREFGIKHYLPKPFDLDRLLHTVALYARPN